MQHCLILYHRLESDDCIRTTINTLKKYSDCQIHVYSDTSEFENHYPLKPEQVENRLALCKLECTLDLMYKVEGNLFVADADLYFRDDPFKIFEKDFDLAVTSRGYKHSLPINGGVYFFRINDQTRNLTKANISQAIKPTWKTFNRLRTKRYGVHWTVGQAFLNACWKEKEKIERQFNIKIIDAGPEYNFCPDTNSLGVQEGIRQLREASNNIKIFHLKSKLKRALYQDWLKDAVTEEPTDRWYV